MILVPRDVVDVGQDKFHPGLHQHHVSYRGEKGVFGHRWGFLGCSPKKSQPGCTSGMVGRGNDGGLFGIFGVFCSEGRDVVTPKGGSGGAPGALEMSQECGDVALGIQGNKRDSGN